MMSWSDKKSPQQLVNFNKLVVELEKTTIFHEGISTQNVDGSLSLPHYKEISLLLELRQEFYKLGFIISYNWIEDKESKKLLNKKTTKFEILPFESLCKLLTIIVRSDRFCEGNFISYLENGIVLKILKGIQKAFEDDLKYIVSMD